MSAASNSSAPDAEFPDDAIEVARIVGAWGVKGWIRVQPYASDPKALFSSKRWFLRASQTGPERRDKPIELPTMLRVAEAREHGGDVVAGLRDITDRSGAEALRGARIFVSRHSFPSAGSDEYYWVDLIGVQVVNRSGDALGQVVDLIDNGVHCILRVRPQRHGAAAMPAERLIPFVSAYVDEVDLPGRRITVDWGLDY